ncbi:hypothetical protein Efla_007068 [Eimeria flavescens]
MCFGGAHLALRVMVTATIECRDAWRCATDEWTYARLTCPVAAAEWRFGSPTRMWRFPLVGTVWFSERRRLQAGGIGNSALISEAPGFFFIKIFLVEDDVHVNYRGPSKTVFVVHMAWLHLSLAFCAEVYVYDGIAETAPRVTLQHVNEVGSNSRNVFWRRAFGFASCQAPAVHRACASWDAVGGIGDVWRIAEFQVSIAQRRRLQAGGIGNSALISEALGFFFIKIFLVEDDVHVNYRGPPKTMFVVHMAWLHLSSAACAEVYVSDGIGVLCIRREFVQKRTSWGKGMLWPKKHSLSQQSVPASAAKPVRRERH